MNTANPQPSRNDDEIDLFELVMTLWRSKGIIIVITLICTIIAIVAAYKITPSYRTQSVLKPINPSTLYAFKSLNGYAVTADSLYADVEKELHSYRNQEQFLLENEALLGTILTETEPDLKEQVADKFLTQNFKIKAPEKEATAKKIVLELTYPQGVKGPTLLNNFVKFTSDKVKLAVPEAIKTQIATERMDLQDQLAILLTGYNTSIESDVAKLTEKDTLKQLQLQDELNSLQQELKRKRDNRIAVLNEAIDIATTLGFKKPTSYNAESNKSQSANVIRAEITQQQTPLYFLGTEVLTAERDALLARENDDFTSNRIAEIESELRLLKNNRAIEVLTARENPDLFFNEITTIKQKLTELNIIERSINDTIIPLLPTFEIIDIDEKAIRPLSPSKPNKKLIAVIGFLLGGMLAVMFVLLRQAIRNYKLRNADSQ